LRAETPRRLQLELHLHPDERVDWTLPGPRVQLLCRDPDAREGYAARFEYRATAHGVDFVRVRRDAGQGHVLMAFELGRDLPLRQDVVCSVGFSEWLLEQASTLYLLDAPKP
jgi:hypothetical protein